VNRAGRLSCWKDEYTHYTKQGKDGKTMSHLKTAAEWVGILWLLAVLVSMIGLWPVLLLGLQPWWPKGRLWAGKCLKLLGGWLGFGIGIPFVIWIVLNGVPLSARSTYVFSVAAMFAGFWGFISYSVYHRGEESIKKATKQLEK